jgi:uncharacterized protein YyaL (SSP411 family)
LPVVAPFEANVTTSERPTNRLALESSPYLRQHAHNPVDWYAWSDEALTRARVEDKPILLSVGYSACHWCHVMEHESFEDAATAAEMNALFVSIKVDREERPDLDQIYQTAVQVLGRHGGWPLTMFLTPDLKPFYGGTYFPPVERHGLPSFRRVLKEVAEAYREQRVQVDHRADEFTDYLREVEGSETSGEQPLRIEAVKAAADSLLQRFDTENGGFGRRPKFPNSVLLELWLRHGADAGEPSFTERVAFALQKMIEGGLYDQLGGGFHRYSTDERWLVPHFEKMLYDNALLLRLLVQTYQATHNELFARAAAESADYVLREMQAPDGGFYSTQDADSEGEEGRFFVWKPAELQALLGEADAELVGRVLGVTEQGNFEDGRTVLHRASPIEAAAKLLGRDPIEALTAFERSRHILYEAREKRIHPARDEKVLAGWNGLMIESLALAGSVLPNGERFLVAAERGSEFVARQLWSSGVLLRTWRDGKAKIPAFAEDHAFVAEGELALLSATGDLKHFERAQQLIDLAVALFADAEGGGFFVTRADGEALIHRPRASYDNAVPSATSSLVMALLRMHALSGEGRYGDIAERALRAYHQAMAKNPFGYGYLWCGYAVAVRGVATLVVTGKPGDPISAALERTARKCFRSNLFILRWSGVQPVAKGLASLLEGKGDSAAAYLCHAGSCSAPVRTPEALRLLLAA